MLPDGLFAFVNFFNSSTLNREEFPCIIFSKSAINSFNASFVALVEALMYSSSDSCLQNLVVYTDAASSNSSEMVAIFEKSRFLPHFEVLFSSSKGTNQNSTKFLKPLSLCMRLCTSQCKPLPL